MNNGWAIWWWFSGGWFQKFYFKWFSESSPHKHTKLLILYNLLFIAFFQPAVWIFIICNLSSSSSLLFYIYSLDVQLCNSHCRKEVKHSNFIFCRMFAQQHFSFHIQFDWFSSRSTIERSFDRIWKAKLKQWRMESNKNYHYIIATTDVIMKNAIKNNEDICFHSLQIANRRYNFAPVWNKQIS